MSGHLCLKWNNHSSAFLKSISNIHVKERYCDATLACQGKFFPVHRFVLSACSDYFEEILGRMQCPHPYIIFKDIEPREMELLLNYMYHGEVNVVQERLPTLIKAAEALQIKGLAVPDDMPTSKEGKEGSGKKRSATGTGDAPLPKRRSEERHRKWDSSSDSLRLVGAEGTLSSRDPSTSSSHKSEDFEPKVIKEEPLDPIIPCSDFVPTEPPPLIKTEFDDVDEILDGDSNSMGKENTLFTYPGLDPSAATFSKMDEAIPSADQFDNEQSSSWGDYASDSVAQGLPPPKMGPQDDMPQQRSTDTGDGSTQVAWNTADVRPQDNEPNPSLKRTRNMFLRCPHCDYRSYWSHNMKTHIMARHVGVKPYHCTFCPMRFAVKCNLIYHTQTHMGQKPFRCDVCSQKFSRNSNLQRHMMRIHQMMN